MLSVIGERTETRRLFGLGLLREERRGEMRGSKEDKKGISFRSNGIQAPSCMIPVNIWDTFQGAERAREGHSSGYEPNPGLVVRDTFIRSLLAVVICHLYAFGQSDFTLHFNLSC